MSENVFVYDSTSPNGQKVYKTLEEFSVHNPAKPLKSIKVRRSSLFKVYWGVTIGRTLGPNCERLVRLRFI